MSYFSLYLISILDNVQTFFVVVFFLLFIGMIFLSSIIYSEGGNIKRLFKILIPIFIFFSLGFVFIPSTDSAWKIIVVHKLSTNKSVKDISSTGLKVTEDYLKKIQHDLENGNNGHHKESK